MTERPVGERKGARFASDCSRGEFAYACARCSAPCCASDEEFAEQIGRLCPECRRDDEEERTRSLAARRRAP